MSKILLHTCCAPCTTYVNKWLNEHDFEVKGFFYNPNIRPALEYEKRLLTMEYYATSVGLKVIFEPNDIRTKEDSCENCYRLRLTRAARRAKDLGFDCFSTTLLISPYQKHDMIKGIGISIGKVAGIEFFYRDFRIGYRESRQMAREMKLYMQKHCGCGVESEKKEEKVYAEVG